jgi:hypothetical protein
VVTSNAAYLAWLEYSIHNSMSLFSSVMAFLAVVFNPIFPIYFPRAVWGFIDVLSALVFMTHGVIVYVREHKINLRGRI